jgi:hypothetical protein
MVLSKQMTFTLTCAALVTIMLSGTAGYLSARMEALDRAEQRLRMMEFKLRQEAVSVRPVAVPAPGAPCQAPSRRAENQGPDDEPPMPAAFVPVPVDSLWTEDEPVAVRERLWSPPPLVPQPGAPR